MAPVGTVTLSEVLLADETVAWGLCDLGMGFPEFGTVRLSELASIKSPFGLGVERDLHFKADKPISAYIDEASKLGRINA